MPLQQLLPYFKHRDRFDSGHGQTGGWALGNPREAIQGTKQRPLFASLVPCSPVFAVSQGSIASATLAESAQQIIQSRPLGLWATGGHWARVVLAPSSLVAVCEIKPPSSTSIQSRQWSRQWSPSILPLNSRKPRFRPVGLYEQVPSVLILGQQPADPAFHSWL